MSATQPAPTSRSRTGTVLLKIAASFLILEPVWMLLPFAGFLYGSVMHIRALSENPWTAPLVYFVLPTHTLFPLGLLLILAGSLLFLTGAGQIYLGQLRHRGLIRTGLYGKFRHPQYLALSLFGIGILLTWGRLLSFISFFVMLWLYYLLARHEEDKCRQRFGREYEEYRAATWFIFPGLDPLLRAARQLLPARYSSWTRTLLSLLLVFGLATGSGLLIIKARSATRQSIPVLVGSYALPGRAALPLLLVKGPALQAAPAASVRDEFMAERLPMLLASPAIGAALAKLELPADTTLLAFLTPGDNWFDRHLDLKRAQVDVMLFCLQTPVAYTGDNFREFRRDWRIIGLIKATNVSPDRLAEGIDPVAGTVTDEAPKQRMNERIDFLLSGLH